MKVNTDDLRGQMARGAVGPTQPNLSPSPAGMALRGLGGALGGIQANPARNGPTPISAPPGGMASPGVMAAAGRNTAPSLDSVRKHGLALGGLKHLADIHGSGKHGPAIKAMTAHSQAHIAGYKGKSAPTPNMAPKPSFGQLGATPEE